MELDKTLLEQAKNTKEKWKKLHRTLLTVYHHKHNPKLVQIQSLVRGHQARKQFAKEKSDLEEALKKRRSAKKIQSLLRGHRPVKKLQNTRRGTKYLHLLHQHLNPSKHSPTT